jgi:hypothetical protein
MTESEPFFFSQPDSKTAASSIQAASAFANSILVGCHSASHNEGEHPFPCSASRLLWNTSDLLDLFRQIG